MTTKTMDSESYLANLESADEQTHSEYIKKSDVLAIIQAEITRLNGSSTLDDIVEKLESLPTINPEGALEEMICESQSREYGKNKELDNMSKIFFEGRTVGLLQALSRVRKQ